jgi:hypothetical protein
MENNIAYLLFEVPPILLVDKHEIQVVTCTKFLVHFAKRWCEIKATEE